MGVCSDMNFLLKLIAAICNTVSLVLWVTGKGHDNGMAINRSQQALFAHTVPAYMIVLIGMVLIYILDEPPGRWFQRIFGCTGIILFIVTGVIAIINCLDEDRSTYAVLIAALCITCGILLLVDFVKGEGYI